MTRRCARRSKQLSAESLVYGLGQVSGRAVQLLLVPVLTRVLARGEYGVSDLVFAYLQTAVLVLVFGMDGALGALLLPGAGPRGAHPHGLDARSPSGWSTGVARRAAARAVRRAALAARWWAADVYRKYLLHRRGDAAVHAARAVRATTSCASPSSRGSSSR